jgi:hypothetical protein
MKNNASRYSPKEISRLMKERGTGPLSLGRNFSEILFRSLSQLPREVVDWALENIIFISDLDVFSAYVINLEEALSKGKIFLIVLGGTLLKTSEEEQDLTVAHEIAHCCLGHHTLFLDQSSIKKSEATDEGDADALALLWLRK